MWQMGTETALVTSLGNSIIKVPNYVVTKCWIPFAICSIQIQADCPIYEGVSAH